MTTADCVDTGPVRAAVYLRQSSDPDQDELAVARQRKDMLALCKQRGWQHPIVFEDNDTSANKRGVVRPGYQAMMSEIRSGSVNAVVCWAADRLYRKPRELEDLIDLADDRVLSLVTMTGEMDLATDTGRMVARLLVAVARGEVERKHVRQCRRALQDAERGMPYAKRAFGYDGNNLVPEEASAIQDAYTALLAGQSLYGIAVQWNSQGFTTGAGNRWDGGNVKWCLRNPRNAGLRVYRGEVIEPTDDWTPTWTAIVSRDVWDSARTLLADPARRSGKSRARKHLLSGLVLCGECDWPLRSGVAQRGRLIYACKNPACRRVTRDMAKVDKLVIDVVCGRLARPDAVEVFAQRGKDIRVIRDQVNALRKLITAAQTDYDNGDVTAARMNARIAALQPKLAKAESEMLDANASRVLDGLIGHPDAGVRFGKLSLDRQRSVIDTVCAPKVRKPITQSGRVFDPTLVDIGWKHDAEVADTTG